MNTPARTLALIVLCAAAVAAADRVSVTRLPRDRVDITGAGAAGHHVLSLGADGRVLSWRDARGNDLVAPGGHQYKRQFYAIEVLAKPGARKPVVPAKGGQLSIRRASATRVSALISAADGPALVCTVEPDRLGLSVAGDAASYVLAGRARVPAPGTRVLAGDKALWAAAGLSPLPGPALTLASADWTRALRLTLPDDRPVSFSHAELDNWGWRAEHIAWSITLKPGETIWLSSVPAPPVTGPVRVGMRPRAQFRPVGPPLTIAELSSDTLAPGKAVTVRLSKPADALIPGGRLYAALYPVAPTDPVRESEDGRWYTRFDRAWPAMRPLTLEQQEQSVWALTPPEGTPPGPRRLRLWVIPKDHPVPSLLTQTEINKTLPRPVGLEGRVMPYFPGLNGRAGKVTQPWPTGDALVTVAGPETAGGLALIQPQGRTAFWRGEPAPVLAVVRGAGGPVTIAFRLTGRRLLPSALPTADLLRALDHPISAAPDADVPLDAGPLRIAAGAAEIVLDTAALAPGRYTLHAEADGLNPAALTLVVPHAEPGPMPLFNSPLTPPRAEAAHARFGVSAWVDVMPPVHGFTPAWPRAAHTARGLYAGSAWLPPMPPLPPGRYDALTREGMMLLQGVQSRQISFALHHSIPEQVAEKARKNLLYAQFQRRLPGMLGLVLDYDVCGATGSYLFSQPYRAAHKRRQALLLARWQAEAERLKTQGVTGSALKRAHNLFYAGVFEQMYSRSVAELHRWCPTQRHTTAATADHCPIDGGQYLPVIYGPLDYRYLETWNDQIYTNSAHDMQESFWTSLLMMGKPEGQPLWITIPSAPQPGTYLRRALEAIARGATAVGYGAEGNTGMRGGWGVDPTEPGARLTHERISAELARSVGPWLSGFRPAEPVAILYSVTQGGKNWGLVSRPFFAYYTLAQANRPARLLTEREIADGKLSRVKALLVVAQTESLPKATLAAIARFSEAGGIVLADKDTTADIPGARKLENVGWARSLWPNGGNAYHDLIEDMARRNGQPLAKALGAACRPPVDLDPARATVSWMQGEMGLLVFVTNNAKYPLGDVFTETQRHSRYFRQFRRRGGIFYKDVRIPQEVSWRLREDLAGASVYDLWSGAELDPNAPLDLASLSARVLLVSKQPRQIIPAFRSRMMAFRADKQPEPRAAVRVRPAVQVAGPQRVLQTLKAKGLAVYVDARQAGMLDAARRLAAAVPGAEIVSNPDVHDYPVAWDPKPEDEATKRNVLDNALLGWRRAAETRLQWTGAMVPRAVWNRPCVLFGTREDNRLIADLDTVTLLDRPARPGLIGPGRAVIQPVASPFWHGQDAVVILCEDLAGLAQATETLAALLKGGQPAGARPLSEPGRAAAERLRAIGFRDKVASKQPEAGAEEKEKPEGSPKSVADDRFSRLLPIVAVAPTTDGFLVALGVPGRNLLRIDQAGNTVWNRQSGFFYQPKSLLASPAGESVVSDGTFAWRHAADGRVLWKIHGQSVRAPETDGSCWVRAGRTLRRVSPEADTLETYTCRGKFITLSADGSVAIENRPGKGSATESEAHLAAVRRKDGKILWRVDRCDLVEWRQSPDGRVLAWIENENLAGRDDLDRGDASRLGALWMPTGKVLARVPVGRSLASVRTDGTKVVARKAGGSLRRLQLDLAGPLSQVVPDSEKAKYTAVFDPATAPPVLTAICEGPSLPGVRPSDMTTFAMDSQGNPVRGSVHGRLWSRLFGHRPEDHSVWLQIPRANGPALAEEMREAREAPLVGSEDMKPNEVGVEITLKNEALSGYNRKNGCATMRADGINPLKVGVYFPDRGQYRLVFELGNPKGQAEKMGTMHINVDKSGFLTAFKDADPWHQEALIDVEAGARTLVISPKRPWTKGGWKTPPMVRTLRVEKVATK